jgi:hypothetical protein
VTLFLLGLLAGAAFGALVARVGQLRRCHDLFEDRLATVEMVLGAVASDPALCCDHGILRTVHCDECERELNTQPAER